LFVFALVGCGGGSSIPPSPSGGGNTTNTVSATFTNGTPIAVAEQIGAGSFTAASLQGGKLTLTLPQGVTKYAVAYVCPPVPDLLGDTVHAEFILEATLQDETAYSLSCSASVQPATDHATGKVDASLIPGATSVDIVGPAGSGGSVNGVNGSFDVMLPTGMDDIAGRVFDASGNFLAVKIVRGQSVPGAVNGGNTIVFSSSDATTGQPVTVTNIPAGFDAPRVGVLYSTANGTKLVLNSGSPNSYRALPAAAIQPGDFYSYASNTADTATHTQAVSVTQTTTTGGGPATIALPAPWSYAGPAAAPLPTFTFNYSGFSGLPAVADQARIGWGLGGTTLYSITVTATSSFENGNHTITFPDLISIPRFLPPPPSGTTIGWTGDVFGGTAQGFTFFPNPPANGSISFVQEQGTYIEP
jgi:hypothetical protein